MRSVWASTSLPIRWPAPPTPAARSLAFLNQNLPLVNVSLKDILGYATSFSNFLARLVNDPSSSLQSLANQIAGLLGDSSVTGSTLAPANGVLSSAAKFQVVLNGGTGVQVTCRRTRATRAWPAW